MNLMIFHGLPDGHLLKNIGIDMLLNVDKNKL